MAQKIILITQDHVEIIGNYYPARKDNAPAVILLHMMPATKESWEEFAQKLQTAGYQAFVIDERGHGESVRQAIPGSEERILDWHEFSDEEQQAKKWDVEAARVFFIQKGTEAPNIIVGGASIGANLALHYLADHPESPAAFALSPGLNYKGIETPALMERLHDGQRVFLAATEDDPQSAEAVGVLERIGIAQRQTHIFADGGHGTDMFGKHPELCEEIIVWLGTIKN